jgi:hypothetical protein
MMEMINTKILELYNEGYKINDIATSLKIGTKKVRDILHQQNLDTSKKRDVIKKQYKVNDYKIEKYPSVEGFYYIAKDKNSDFETLDYNNKAGILTSFIKEHYNISIPSLYDRRKYYMITGEYWWEQWFDIVKKEKQQTKKCPFCDWETIDVENKSGAFENHLKRKHNISKNDYIKLFPNEISYFELSCPTLNRQFSTNPHEYVVCQICGKKLSRIDNKHLSKHNITKKEYVEKYGKTISDKLFKTLSKQAIKLNKTIQRSFVSKPEQEIIDWLIKNNIELKKDRKILKGQEIDIFIPSKKIAIEFNGNKYHTEWFGGKTRQYHLSKTKNCKNNGVRLIHIFEDEFFYKKEIVLNKLSHLLEMQNNLPKIYGRKCIIHTINKKDAETFLETYHIQGYDPSTIHYGAFYDNELIAVMSFLKSKKNGNEWELTRFASNYNFVCCGVGGKLFKAFVRDNNPNIVKSFADRRWTINENNNLYINLGFKFDSYTNPEYRYYNTNVDRYKRWHKFGFRKHILLKKYPEILNNDMTETEMVKKLGYDRIWDCGLIKYVWTK